MQYLSQGGYQHCNNDYGGRGLSDVARAAPKGIGSHKFRDAQKGEATSVQRYGAGEMYFDHAHSSSKWNYTRMLSVD